MNDRATGYIKAIRKDGKGFQLDDGNWYGVFAATQLKANKGDYVEFAYKSVIKNGNEYRNVQGVVSGTAVSPTGGSMREIPENNSGGQSRSPLMLPVMLARERAIIRQNALTNAVALCSTNNLHLTEGTHPEAVIKIAREFEAYTSGDYDIDTARRSLEEESVDGAS